MDLDNCYETWNMLATYHGVKHCVHHLEIRGADNPTACPIMPRSHLSNQLSVCTVTCLRYCLEYMLGGPGPQECSSADGTLAAGK